MKTLLLIGKIACVVAFCASLAASDSLQLRNGRHLQGKFVGGSTNMIGFMTSGTIEYFSTSDVLALMFENNSESPLGGLQPNHMKGDAAVGQSGNLRTLSSKTTKRKNRAKGESVSLTSASLSLKD